MASDEDFEIPVFGAVFTFGRSAFAENQPSHFFIRNDPVVEISCGDEHTAVVCKNGRVFLFGPNDYGQLGLGHTRIITKPTCLKYLKPFHSTHVACGKGHTVISTECRRLFSFGLNSDGQLGTGDLNDRLVPQLVNMENFSEGRISAVSAGCFHSACLTEYGELYVWGNNSDGQCGVEVDTNLLIPTKIQFENPIDGISCGYYHTAFISEGNLYTFGEQENGKLGYKKVNNSNLPVKVGLDFKCARVECGGNHTLVLSDEGRVFGFGSNFSGQLGLGNNNPESYLPLAVNFPGEIKIIFLSAGESHSAFITEDRQLFMCGDGRYGKICCEDDSKNSTSPTCIKIFTHFHCDFISCGGCQTMVLARNKYNSGDSGINSPQGKVAALPPLKVNKVLKENERESRGRLKNSTVLEAEKSDKDFNNLRANENDVHQEETTSKVENVYANFQDIEIHENDTVIETEKIDSAFSITRKGLQNNPTDVEADVVVRSAGTIKKILHVFKKKKSLATVVMSDSKDVIKKVDCNSEAQDIKNDEQQTSRACSII